MRTGFISRVLGKHAKVDKEILLDCLLEVAEERDLLNLIFDSMTEGVLALDHEENLRFANRRAGELLSFEPATNLRKPLSTFLHDQEILDPVRRCLRSGEGVHDAEAFLFVHEPIVLRVDVVPLSGHGARFGGALVFLLEITEEKKREAEKRESKRLAALATLSASLAHEIRNPLNSMGIHVQLLERQLNKQKAADLLKSTTIIREEIRNLNDKLTRFLDAARPRQPQFEPVSVHELLEETLGLLRPEFEQSGITPEYYPPPVHTTVFADRVDLRRAFVNILKNAIEAMRTGGRIVIRIEVMQEKVTLTFKDSGEGISEDILDKVFDLGFTTKDTGSGLGLAQVERCIREHLGHIEISSTPGQGVVLRIDLPVLSQGRQLLGMTPQPAMT
jgi:signal transduction histidine kinase